MSNKNELVVVVSLRELNEETDVIITEDFLDAFSVAASVAGWSDEKIQFAISDYHKDGRSIMKHILVTKLLSKRSGKQIKTLRMQ